MTANEVVFHMCNITLQAYCFQFCIKLLILFALYIVWTYSAEQDGNAIT